MVQRVTTNDNEWYNEWQWVVQRVTTNDSEWYKEWQRMTTSGITSDNKWQRMTTSGTTNDSEWQRVVQRLAAKVSRPFQTYINQRVLFHHFLRRLPPTGADPGFCQGGWLAGPKNFWGSSRGVWGVSPRKFLKLKVPDWLKMHFLAPLQ